MASPATASAEFPGTQSVALRLCRKRLGPLIYRHSSHATLPHVLSFSGGRSSAALLFMAAEEGLLNASRGDVVLFANTSAEHPGTYEFAAECKRRIEADFGLPVLWFEFTTVEDAWRGEYWRKLNYRLVKPIPIENDPDGYQSHGELFEDLVSLQGMLPNVHSRTCTAKLKLYPSHLLLGEWLGGTEGPAHAGHHWCETGDQEGEGGLISPRRVADRYSLSNGTATRESVIRRAEHLNTRPSARPQQFWEDYTDAPVHATTVGAAPAPMRGPGAALHVRLLGLRADEDRRVSRVLSRSLFAEGATTAKCSVKTQPPGERPYFPLHEAGFVAGDVRSFWQRRDFDLDVPADAGNCVFCFMKGTRQLVELGRNVDPRRRAGAPSDIGWWADFEERHVRLAPKRGGTGISRFGFFGVNARPFADLAEGLTPQEDRYATGTPACDCTD